MTKSLKYLTVTDNIPNNIENYTILNINSNNVAYLTHCFHKYPAKFIPQVPHWAISKYLKNRNKKLILDPFCGSGTTLVEGILAGHNVIGIDVDPLSILISKVKTTIVNEQLLGKIIQWVIDQINPCNSISYRPDCSNIEHWFTEENIKKLSLIRTIIDNVIIKFGNVSDVKNIQDLLFIAFSSIIRRVSNADNESQKTYVSHTNKKTPEEPLELFMKQINMFKQRIIYLQKLVNDDVKCKVVCMDIRNGLDKIVNNHLVELAITSPPYIKAIDYIYNQMVELFWIGDLFGLQTQELQNKKKKEYIGSKYFHKQDYAKYSPFSDITNIDELDEKLRLIYSKDAKNGHKHSFITYKYFLDMDSHFIKMSKVMKQKAHYIMVLGNSNVSNITINTTDYIIKLASQYGFELINIWGYQIKNRFMRFDRKGRGGLIELDWVLDFIKE